MEQKIKFLFILSFFMLSSMGLGNYFLSSIGIAGWKQLLMILLLPVAIFSASKILEKSFFSLLALILAAIACIYTFIVNGGIVGIVFNVWFYIAWVPFFLYFSKNDPLLFFSRYKNFLLAFVLVSALGIYVDMSTGYFSFLSANEESAAYAQLHGIAMRSAFWFVASTIVTPVVCGMAVIYFMLNPNSINQIAVCLAIIVCGYSTGSLSGLFVSIVFSVAAIFSISKGSSIKMFLLSALALAFVWLAIGLVADTSQFIRISENLDMNSRANIGRIEHWNYALLLIGDFSMIEHVFGLGLGVTNSQHNVGYFIDTHGESSFLQAYLEAGLLGVVIRLIPFLVIFVAMLKGLYPNGILVFVYTVSVLSAVAFAPTFGATSLQVMIGVIAGIGVFRSKVKNVQ